MITCGPYWSGGLVASQIFSELESPLNSTKSMFDVFCLFFSCQIRVFLTSTPTRYMCCTSGPRVFEIFVFYKDSPANGWPLVWQQNKL